MKRQYWLSHRLLKLKAWLLKKKLVYLGKDYFIYHNWVVEIKWLKVLKRFTYNNTVMFLTGTKFYINNETVIDIEDWIKVLFHWLELRKNNIGFIIDNKQYNGMLEQMDDWDVYWVLYNFLITKKEVKKGYIYKVMNLQWEKIHEFPTSRDRLILSPPVDDYITFKLWNHQKTLHIGWFPDVIKELKK